MLGTLKIWQLYGILFAIHCNDGNIAEIGIMLNWSYHPVGAAALQAPICHNQNFQNFQNFNPI